MITRLQAYLAQPGTDGVPRTLLLTTHQADLARPLAKLTLTLQSGHLVPNTLAAPISPAMAGAEAR